MQIQHFLLFNLHFGIAEEKAESGTTYRSPRGDRTKLKLVELNSLGFSICIGVCRLRESVDQASSSLSWDSPPHLRTRSHLLSCSSSWTWSPWEETGSSSWPSAVTLSSRHHVIFPQHLILHWCLLHNNLSPDAGKLSVKEEVHLLCWVHDPGVFLLGFCQHRKSPPHSHGHWPPCGHLWPLLLCPYWVIADMSCYWFSPAPSLTSIPPY